MYKSKFEFLAPVAIAWLPDEIEILLFNFFKLEIAFCESNPCFAAAIASVCSLNCDFISFSSSWIGIPRIFIKAPDNAIFRFRPNSLNCSPKIVIPFFLSACLWVFIVRSSRATNISIFASWDSIGSSEIESVLKL